MMVDMFMLFLHFIPTVVGAGLTVAMSVLIAVVVIIPSVLLSIVAIVLCCMGYYNEKYKKKGNK